MNQQINLEETTGRVKKMLNRIREMISEIQAFMQMVSELQASRQMEEIYLEAARETLKKLMQLQQLTEAYLSMMETYACLDAGFSDLSGAVRESVKSYKAESEKPSAQKELQETKTNPADSQSVPLSKVEFSAVAPKVLEKDEYSIIHVIMYEEHCRQIVDEMLKSMDEPGQETRSGIQTVSEGSEVKIVLESPDITIEENTESGIWRGGHLDFSFPILVPADYGKQKILVSASVYINGVIASKLRFVMKCVSLEEQKVEVSRKDILSAFMSYASQDRNHVVAIIQGLKKARPDLDVFFDIDSLRSGDDWEKRIYKEIEKRDMLFLCWSHHAAQSEWVNMEWHYALEKKGADVIEPIPIESPEQCPPPEELRKKHFNDSLLYLIKE